MSEFARYEQMRDEGQSPVDVYLAARTDQVKQKDLLRLIRTVFKLSLNEAREVLHKGEEQEFLNNTKQYQQMRAEGANPQQVYRAAKKDGIGGLDCLRLLRTVFDLSLLQAKEIFVVAEGIGNSLDDYQAKLAVGLKKAIAEMEEELTSSSSEDQEP